MSTCRPRRKPTPESPQSGALQIDILPLLPWAKGIARGVCGDAGFRRGSADEQILESEAVEVIVEYANRFDELRLPEGGNIVGAFKGWASIEIRSRCRRLVTEMRGGGTVGKGSSEDAQAVRVQALPLTADGSDVALPWPECEREEEPAPVVCRYEPVLTVVGRAPAGG